MRHLFNQENLNRLKESLKRFWQVAWHPMVLFSVWVLFTITIGGAILGMSGWQTLGLIGWQQAGIAILMQLGFTVVQSLIEQALYHYDVSTNFLNSKAVQEHLLTLSNAELALLGLKKSDNGEKVESTTNNLSREIQDKRDQLKKLLIQKNAKMLANSLFAGVMNTIIAAMGSLVMMHLAKIIKIFSILLFFGGFPTAGWALPFIFKFVVAPALGSWLAYTLYNLRNNNKDNSLKNWGQGIKLFTDMIYFAISFSMGAHFGMFARSTVFMNTLPKFAAQSFQWIKPALLQARSISVEFMHAVSATLLSALYHLLRGFEQPSKESFFSPVDQNSLRTFAQAMSVPKAARSGGNSQKEPPATSVDDCPVDLDSTSPSRSNSARSSRSNSVGSSD